jgi:hypothetical protein
MSEYLRILEQLLGGVTIHSPTSFSWFGVRVGDLPPQSEAAMDAASARAYLVY